MNTRAGQPAQPSDLIDVHELIAAYFEKVPDVSIPAGGSVSAVPVHDLRLLYGSLPELQ